MDARLRAILAPYRDRFAAREDATGVVLEMKGHEGAPWGYVAGTRLCARYVSYYLMGVYAMPELLDGMSPELRRRMQGKSCFNFSAVDERLLGELETLTAHALARHEEVVASALASKRRKG